MTTPSLPQESSGPQEAGTPDPGTPETSAASGAPVVGIPSDLLNDADLPDGSDPSDGSDLPDGSALPDGSDLSQAQSPAAAAAREQDAAAAEPGEQREAHPRSRPYPAAGPGTPQLGLSPQAYTWGTPLPADPPAGGMNGQAVTSFVLGLLAIIPISIVFGIIALVRISRNRQRGKGLAVAGLVLSGVWTLAATVAILLGAACTSAHPGPFTPTADIRPVYTLAPGTCFDVPARSVTDFVTVVSCDQPHDRQLYAKIDLHGPYPAGSRAERTPGSPASGPWAAPSSTPKASWRRPARSSTPRCSRPGWTACHRPGARSPASPGSSAGT
ncbi:DUF4190 domain-containing protein [Streptacidiphilus sp. 4-A2]|nr:DUF4190 domain-containing protein [Streptacidiphilus sp. 4-A2]